MMKYEIILSYIKSEILKNNIKIGEKLPSIRSLCDEFQCSKVTAVKVYDILEKEHIVYSIPKSGHYLIKENLNLNKYILDKKIDFSTSKLDRDILPDDEFQYCIDGAMKLYKENIFLHAHAQGMKNLIDVIVKQLQDYQVFTDKKCVFITSGSQQAINILTMMPFPNNKENVLIEQPTYYGVIKSLEINNINTIGIKRKYNGIDFNELENIFKNYNIKFFYTIPRFHNPTGFSYSNSEKKQILKLAEKYDVYIVEDDYLADLEIDKKSDPIYALDISSRVIYLKPYSKIILPGLRVSAAVLPKLLIGTFEKYKRWSDLNTSLISQGALEIYIKSGMFNSHRKKLKKIYSQKMSYLNELTKGLNNNIEWHVPSSGFFASFETKNRINITKIIKSLNNQNILLKDPKIFYLNNYIEEKLIRLSISMANNNQIKEGINRLIKEI
ncbi:PLP-dependent aminotransferase family protein [Clostridium sp. 3-3]|nr:MULTISPECIES: PLP-dependent aminotransferase family protein [Clostridium]MZI79956.1 aminotransferase class I/II-fold pyridoxal phosphate-dependent enzyme [Clostridium butyricum]POO86613.1 GntR family transcriptional regulator [Clostridium sp. 3-3]QUF82845.1 PLP-dependent aminotransferase family protein [Clostridium butyricum]UZT05802.1 PLP-dependent aminotransferase family protein [Clostridium sp. LQ25]